MESKRTGSYRVCLIGAPCSGKTKFVQQLFGQFESHSKHEYVPTQGCSFYNKMTFHTNHGEYKLDFWDTGAQPKCQGLGAGYYFGSHAALAFYSQLSDCKETDKFVRDYAQVAEKSPIINIWTQKNVIRKNIDKLMGYRPTFTVDSPESQILIKPILKLLIDLTGHEDLQML